MNRIDGKIAIVTGATQGLGAAVARAFAEAGAQGIVIVGRGFEKGIKVAEGIESATGVPVETIKADLGRMEDVQTIVPKTESRFGRVDILVNCAALTDRGNILDTSQALFDTIFAVNVRAPFFLMQDSAKSMIAKGIEGAIVNIGSTSALAGQPFLSPYSTSKGALATLTRNTGFALMRNRIRVNQLNIGWMNSDHERKLQAEESGDPDFIDKEAAKTPFGRLLDPAEVARAVLWVASGDSGMMTGSVIQFDQSVWGGYDGQPPAPANPLRE
ncbi:SDR family oxidoreductase [Thioalkalivibrio sp. HK1]|uniref:SDR family oxidoreductase n=1 Tax=Thioalkalivibrio sp. HK1 TaxID=1469245 RepID=UPI000470B63F|nr:SDR family oxidoreductase [Thioalkalivibrio sp. HK1]